MVQNPEFGETCETLHVCRWNDPYLPYLLYIPILVMKSSISIAWINYGKSPFSMGKSPFLMGTSPFLMGKSTINGPLSQTFAESQVRGFFLFVSGSSAAHCSLSARWPKATRSIAVWPTRTWLEVSVISSTTHRWFPVKTAGSFKPTAWMLPSKKTPGSW